MREFRCGFCVSKKTKVFECVEGRCPDVVKKSGGLVAMYLCIWLCSPGVGLGTAKEEKGGRRQTTLRRPT